MRGNTIDSESVGLSYPKLEHMGCFDPFLKLEGPHVRWIIYLHDPYIADMVRVHK